MNHFINTCQEHTIINNYRFVNSWGVGVRPLAVSQTYFSIKESDLIREEGKRENLSLLLSNRPVPPGSRTGFEFKTLHGQSLAKVLPSPPLTNNLQPRRWERWHLWWWRLDLGKKKPTHTPQAEIFIKKNIYEVEVLGREEKQTFIKHLLEGII